MSYLELTPDSKPAELVGKKVSFYGKRSLMVAQHMMSYSPSFSSKELCEDTQKHHFYIDLDSGYPLGQIVGYYWGTEFNETPHHQRLKFSGKLGVVSGAGKGGNGKHTEYFLDIEAIE